VQTYIKFIKSDFLVIQVFFINSKVLGVVKRNPLFFHSISCKNNGFLFTTLNITKYIYINYKKTHTADFIFFSVVTLLNFLISITYIYIYIYIYMPYLIIYYFILNAKCKHVIHLKRIYISIVPYCTYINKRRLNTCW